MVAKNPWLTLLKVQVLLLVLAVVLVQVLVVLVVLTTSTPTIDSVSLGLCHELLQGGLVALQQF